MSRKNMLIALALGAVIGGPGVEIAPAEDRAEERARLKREEALRHAHRERLLGAPKQSTVGINRHTGEPHKHSREIERRKRQAMLKFTRRDG